jgi:dynein heavy chain
LASATLTSAATPSKDALDEAAKIKKKFDENIKKISQYKAYQDVLKVVATPIPEVEMFEKKFGVRNRLWEIRSTFAAQKQRWCNTNFREQDAEEIVKITKERETELTKTKNSTLRDTNDEVLEAALAEVRDLAAKAPLIAALGNKAMQDKHWVKVWALVESQPSTLLNFTFNQLIEAGIADHLEKVEEYSASAAGESSILKTVAEIQTAWETTNFVVKPYRDTKDRFYITEIEDLVTQLEDHQMTVQTSMGSKHVVEIRDTVERWEHELAVISDCIDEWLVFQKSWMYLENIFNAEDI